jgi:glycosyltransferase XagB
MTHPPAEQSAGLDVLSRYTLRADAPAEVKLQHAALAADALADTAPDLSARRGRRSPGRKMLAAVVAAGIGAIAILQPLPTAIVFVTVMILAYATTLAHRVWLMCTALRNDATIYVPDEVARALPDHELPVYTVLVPAYREPEVVSAVVASMAALEYPADRLEVLLLLEEDDADTIAAAGVACAGTAVQVVLVPPGEPRTKPKACKAQGVQLRADDVNRRVRHHLRR